MRRIRRIGCQRASTMLSWTPATATAGAGLRRAAEAGVARAAAPSPASRAAVIIEVRKECLLSCNHWKRWRLTKPGKKQIVPGSVWEAKRRSRFERRQIPEHPRPPTRPGGSRNGRGGRRPIPAPTHRSYADADKCEMVSLIPHRAKFALPRSGERDLSIHARPSLGGFARGERGDRRPIRPQAECKIHAQPHERRSCVRKAPREGSK